MMGKQLIVSSSSAVEYLLLIGGRQKVKKHIVAVYAM
jgi:hypothetical protein